MGVYGYMGIWYGYMGTDALPWRAPKVRPSPRPENRRHGCQGSPCRWMVTRWACLPRKLQGITRRPNWLSGAAHTCWDDRCDANLRRSHRVVEQKTARDEVAIPPHHAPAAHRVHS